MREADMLNKIVIGVTSSTYKRIHELSKEDAIRDYFTIEQLMAIKILTDNNIEMLKFGYSHSDRNTILKEYHKYISCEIDKNALHVTDVPDSNDITVTSLEISKLTGKQHWHVLADIRKLIIFYKALNLNDRDAELRGIVMSSYPDAGGKPRVMYELSKNATMDLIMKYSKTFRIYVRIRLSKLENAVRIKNKGKRDITLNKLIKDDTVFNFNVKIREALDNKSCSKTKGMHVYFIKLTYFSEYDNKDPELHTFLGTVINYTITQDKEAYEKDVLDIVESYNDEDSTIPVYNNWLNDLEYYVDYFKHHLDSEFISGLEDKVLIDTTCSGLRNVLQVQCM